MRRIAGHLPLLAGAAFAGLVLAVEIATADRVILNALLGVPALLASFTARPRDVALVAAAGFPAAFLAGALNGTLELQQFWASLTVKTVLDAVGLAYAGLRVRARRALVHQRVLAEAGTMFGAIEDEAGTLEAIVDVLTRRVAAAATVLVADATGGLSVAAGARSPASAPEDLVRTVLERGATLRRDRAVAAPLRARGRVIGVLACTLAERSAADPDAEALVAAVADRAALALDNARLYADRVGVAATLQRSLLPPQLPAVPGVELAARYRPAGDELQVGGDFYDVFALADGSWTAVVGDVSGKGAEAATVTALARHTLRAAARDGAAPAEALAELNAVLRGAGPPARFVTVVAARLVTGDGGAAIELAAGGHPLPHAVRADGRVEVVGTPGTMLGATEDPDLPAVRLTLEPGDALVLHTDGVSDPAAGRRTLTEAGIRTVLAGVAGRSAAVMAERLEAAAVAARDGELRDDLALLVVRAPVPERAPAAPFGTPMTGVRDTP